MRSGACAVQQTLTTEAASVLKQSLSLARRRGHAQVTPLHVAATLLSSRTSLLRRACLKSHHHHHHQPHHHHHQASHPLHCRALELCFNVALNRLPTTPGPLLHGQPSLSNALIAALKRAQAHQRRGCIEQQQQQPLLTIKVELEQLIISILDDPSVSRVMREAGFSSTTIKNHIEDSSASSVFQCYSSSNGGVFSSPCSPSSSETHHHFINPNAFWQNHLFTNYSFEQNPVLFSSQKPQASVNKEDIKLVFEVLLRKKKRNTVIVGDCLSLTEALVLEFMGRVERGDVPQELKQTHVIKFHFSPVTLRFMKKEDVEMNLTELKRKVDTLTSVGGGAIIYTGDLKWTIDHQESNNNNSDFNGDIISCYNPITHLVSEIGKLVSDSNTTTRVWLMATASYQTYTKCQMRHPSLEIQWALQAVSVPSGGLGLSLHSSSVHESRLTFSQIPSQVWETKPFASKEEDDHKLNCCAECTSNFEDEAQLFKSDQKKLLPPWLQSQSSNASQKDELVGLRIKWNRLCHSLHLGRHTQSQFSSNLSNNQCLMGKSYSYTSSYPWWPTQSSIFSDSNSISFAESAMKPHSSSNPVAKFRRQQSCSTIEFNFGSCTQKPQGADPSLLNSLKSSEGRDVKITLALGNSGLSDSENLQRSDLLKLLQENVSWQFDSVHSIVEALVQCKSSKKATWFLLEGNDIIGKRRLALAIAESVFGSADMIFRINMRKRSEDSCSEILMRKLKNHEKLVVLVEDIDLADVHFMKILAEGFETEKFGQVIFVLTKGDSNYEDKIKNQDYVIQMILKVDERNLNLNHKRKAEWDFSSKTRSPRIEEKEDAITSVTIENLRIGKKDFSRQSSFNSTLDLNMKADDEDDESEEKPGEFSPNSSDLTRENIINPALPNGFLDLIQNRFVFNQNSSIDGEITGLFLAKMKESFVEVFKGQNKVNFSVEERVLEEVLIGSGFFLNSLFEKWLKEVFQKSLEAVNIGGKGEGIQIRLCFGGKNGKMFANYGFGDSCLPNKIQIAMLD